MRTEATKQAAVELVRKGIPVSKAAKTYGVSMSCIRLWMKRYQDVATESVKPAATVPPWTTGGRPDLGKVYDAMTTLKQVGLI